MLQVTYVIFLGLFSHVLLSVLEPIDSVSQVSAYEWVIYIWVGSIALQEIQQVREISYCQ